MVYDLSYRKRRGRRGAALSRRGESYLLVAMIGLTAATILSLYIFRT